MSECIEKDPSSALSLMLLVDKDRNRVVFAESDHEFVDVLCSFLTLPIGAVVRLLDKDSSLGSFDRLYSSVEKLEERFFETPACKAMLLRPRNAAIAHCAALAVPLEELESRVYYLCGMRRSFCSFSSVFGAKCQCGRPMETPFNLPNLDGSNGVFVKNATRFLINDDLTVKPVSMTATLEIFSQLGITDAYDLEKRIVTVGAEEVIKLLKRSLISRTPLTDVFLQNPDMISEEFSDSLHTYIAQARGAYTSLTTDSKRIHVKLFLSKESEMVVYAEANEEFVNQLFSFITFPIGSIIRLLGSMSPIWCMNNLYKSVEHLVGTCDSMKSNELSKMLVAPKLAPFFGYSNQLLAIDEMLPRVLKIGGTVKTEINPKLVQVSQESGGRFTTGTTAFMVTDELEVTQLSPISGVHIINKLMVPISSLEEAEATLGQSEILDMLIACLTSRSALSDVFAPNLIKLIDQNWFYQLGSKSKHSSSK